MKLFILISLVALCSSQSFFVGKHVTVGINGLISIIGEQGREIHISRNMVYPQKIDIVLKSLYGPTRKIIIDEVNNIHNVDFTTFDSRYFSNQGSFNNLGNDFTQYDFLLHVFKMYEGIMSTVKYEKMLETIHYLVQQGVLHESIWDVLRYFDNYNTAQNYKQMISNDKFIPYQGYGLEHYGSKYFQGMSTLQRLYYILQQQKINQGINEEYFPQYFNQQYYPTYQYNKMQISPLMKHLWQYQTPMVYNQEYPQSYYYQQEYPQTYYHQQKYNQLWWNPKQYTHYQTEMFPQGWNMAQQHHIFENMPMVYY